MDGGRPQSHGGFGRSTTVNTPWTPTSYSPFCLRYSLCQNIFTVSHCLLVWNCRAAWACGTSKLLLRPLYANEHPIIHHEYFGANTNGRTISLDIILHAKYVDNAMRSFDSPYTRIHLEVNTQGSYAVPYGWGRRTSWSIIGLTASSIPPLSLIKFLWYIVPSYWERHIARSLVRSYRLR